MTLVDTYIPFDTPPGNNATVANWRSMARTWEQSGIISGVGNQFGLAAAISGGSAIIETGAAWIDGFYGEITSNKTVTGIAGGGLIVLHLDPTARTIRVQFNAGATAPVQTKGGIWEIPLYKVTGGTTTTECRQWATSTVDWTSTTNPPALNGNYWPRGRMFRSVDYSTVTAWTDYGFNAISYGGQFFSGYKFVCPIAADYLVIAQVGFTSSAANQWCNARIMRDPAGPAAAYSTQWMGTPNSSAVAADLMVQLCDIVPCTGGDALWITHACNAAIVNGGMYGVDTAFFSVRALP
jgi:hypothetical protein